MKNEHTVLYQLTETSPFMMSFVIVTKQNNAIIIDGGMEADMPPFSPRPAFGVARIGCTRNLRSAADWPTGKRFGNKGVRECSARK